MHTRTKWEKPKRNLRTEDVVLVKEEGAYRNGWPIGRVSEAIASDEGQVRKVQVKIEGLEGGGGVLIPHSRFFCTKIPHPAQIFIVIPNPVFFPKKVH